MEMERMMASEEGSRKQQELERFKKQFAYALLQYRSVIIRGFYAEKNDLIKCHRQAIIELYKDNIRSIDENRWDIFRIIPDVLGRRIFFQYSDMAEADRAQEINRILGESMGDLYDHIVTVEVDE